MQIHASPQTKVSQYDKSPISRQVADVTVMDVLSEKTVARALHNFRLSSSFRDSDLPNPHPKMSADVVARVVSRLQSLPSMSLPTDYPRPSGGSKVVEAAQITKLSDQTCLSLLKLTLFSEDAAKEEEEEEEVDDAKSLDTRPSGFHLLLAAFVVLLHRYTGDTDIVIGSSSAHSRDPLVLRLSIDPVDPFWAVVRKVQQVAREAEADALPFETIVKALEKQREDASETSRPLFRVRFFDETDEHAGEFVRTTHLTTDLTVFITRPTPTSTHHSLAPAISLRILYNSLLFTSARIKTIVDQLSVLLRRVSTNPLASIGAVPLLTPNQRTALPDPTADLHWCDWKGAITDIFSNNALKWP